MRPIKPVICTVIFVIACLFTSQRVCAYPTPMDFDGDTLKLQYDFKDIKIDQVLGVFKETISSLTDKMSQNTDAVNLKLDLDLDLSEITKDSNTSILLFQVVYNSIMGENGLLDQLSSKDYKNKSSKEINKLKKKFKKKLKKEIRKVTKGDRETRKQLEEQIFKLLDAVNVN